MTIPRRDLASWSRLLSLPEKIDGVLVVTGSRSFNHVPVGLPAKAAEIARDAQRMAIEWCRFVIDDTICGMGKNGLVINGGAEGPDSISTELAREYGVPWVVLRPSGVAFASTFDNGRRWAPGKVDPLDRNRAIVQLAACLKPVVQTVDTLGLVDTRTFPDLKKTRGTDSTLRHAEKAGLFVSRVTYPSKSEKDSAA